MILGIFAGSTRETLIVKRGTSIYFPGRRAQRYSRQEHNKARKLIKYEPASEK
jgi:hypothetical protein